MDLGIQKDLLAHRDIKPHNIIMQESGDVFISDFGIALSKTHQKIKLLNLQER